MNFTEVSFFLATANSFIGILPSILAIWTYSSHSREQRLLSYLVWLMTASGIGMEVTAANRINNFFIIHLGSMIEVIMYTLIFKHYLPVGWPKWIIGLFLIAAVGYIVVFDSLYTFNIPIRLLDSILVIIYCLRFFSTTLRQLDIERIDQHPLFWVSTGALIYHLGSFLFFLFGYIIQGLTSNLLYFGLHAFFGILSYLFFAVALWKKPIIH